MFEERNCIQMFPKVLLSGASCCFAVLLSRDCQMLGALEVVARLCSVGLGLKEDAITSLMHEGPHLLAPTGEGTQIQRQRTLIVVLRWSLSHLSTATRIFFETHRDGKCACAFCVTVCGEGAWCVKVSSLASSTSRCCPAVIPEAPIANFPQRL